MQSLQKVKIQTNGYFLKLSNPLTLLNYKPIANSQWKTLRIQKKTVFVGGRLHILPTQVMMLVADINYTTIFLDDGQQFMVATTIGKIQKTLQEHGNFVRTNKSQVVNWAYVLRSNSKELLLKNDEIVRFSRRRANKKTDK